MAQPRPLDELEGAGLIRNERACIIVRDRRGLEAYAGAAYGAPEAEFERLLGDVVKNDSDAKRTDAYLTSETGKVYTMLAHASGRFDGA